MRPRTLDEVVGSGPPAQPRAHRCGRLVESDAALGRAPVGSPGHREDDDRGHRLGIDQPAVRRGPGGLGRRQGVREVIDAGSPRALASGGRETVLFVDEVHRFSKSQQDALLPAVENRWVTLIAATTENPFFSVIAPLLSRSLLLTLEPMSDEAIRTVLERAVAGRAGAARAGRASTSRRSTSWCGWPAVTRGVPSPTSSPRPRRARGPQRGSTVRSTWRSSSWPSTRRRPLRPRRRPALRRDQRLHQVDPRAVTWTPRCTTSPG